MPDGGTRFFSVSGEPRFDADGVFVGTAASAAMSPRSRFRASASPPPLIDALTGLANRTSLAPALEQAIERTRAPLQARRGLHGPGRLQAGNDLHGHAAGDAFLQEVARRAPQPARERCGGAHRRRRILRGARADAGRTAVERVVSKLAAEVLRPYELLAARLRRASASPSSPMTPATRPR